MESYFFGLIPGFKSGAVGGFCILCSRDIKFCHYGTILARGLLVIIMWCYFPATS